MTARVPPPAGLRRSARRRGLAARAGSSIKRTARPNHGICANCDSAPATGYGRRGCRRIARVAVRPEAIGLCGCWQGIAVERPSQDLTAPDEPAAHQIGCYATRLTGPSQPDRSGVLAAGETWRFGLGWYEGARKNRHASPRGRPHRPPKRFRKHQFPARY